VGDCGLDSSVSWCVRLTGFYEHDNEPSNSMYCLSSCEISTVSRKILRMELLKKYVS